MLITKLHDGLETSEGRIANFGILDDFFPIIKKNGFGGILGQPYCGIGATIRIGQAMLCLPYAGFLSVCLMAGSGMTTGGTQCSCLA